MRNGWVNVNVIWGTLITVQVCLDGMIVIIRSYNNPYCAPERFLDLMALYHERMPRLSAAYAVVSGGEIQESFLGHNSHFGGPRLDSFPPRYVSIWYEMGEMHMMLSDDIDSDTCLVYELCGDEYVPLPEYPVDHLERTVGR